MHSTYRTTALELLMDVMPAVKQLVESIHTHDKNLADQVRRAASSVVLNLAEADGSEGGNRRARVRTAYGSLFETRKGLKLAAAWGYVARSEVDALETLLDRVGAMTWRRLHPR
jgi:four helix bundle protein